MTTDKNGGYLFPQDGATMRDFFAISAMKKCTCTNDLDQFAKDCYEIADAFIKERGKING